MSEPQALTDVVLAQVLELTRDHRQVLADLAMRIEPHSDELIQVWTKVYRDAGMHQPPPPDEVIRDIQNAAVELFVGGLREGNLREYYSDFITWGRQVALSGLPYDRLLHLLHEYQRSGLPFLMQAYPPGPELQSAFKAVEDLYNGMITVIGAAYIEAAQEQLIFGARSRTLGQLAGGAAHALNNLLAAILGRTQLLIERARDPEAQSELQEIQRTATVGAQMVGRLQEFSREGREEKFVERDVNHLLREAAEVTRFMWRDRAELDGIVIDIVKDFADVPPIHAHPSELREIFIELILNAIEAMPNGGSITLRTERKGNRVLVSVIDTGEGMPEVTRLRVFDPFFTTKGSTHAGLGLSTAAKIIAQHEGTWTVESQPGRGTTFTLSFPVAKGLIRFTDSAAPSREAAVTAPSPPRGVSILLIDDEPMVRDIIQKFLTFRGHRVAVADTGSEGIAAFKKEGFDLVITDLGMPGMSGWDAAREIKRLNSKVLVVLMTGWSADLDPQKVKESGVDRVVQKPFDVDDVLALVGEAATIREKM